MRTKQTLATAHVGVNSRLHDDVDDSASSLAISLSLSLDQSYMGVLET